MKKILVSVAVIGVIGLFAQHYANAGRGWYGNPGPGCPYWDSGYSQVQDPASQKDIDAFLQTTADLRKTLVMKEAEYQALMNSTNPDPAKAGALTGEIFQLRSQIRAKAVEAGLPSFYGRGGNPGMGRWGGGYGQGYGPRGGRGLCRGYMY